MTIGARYRDKIGSEIRPKHGDTLIRTLRKTYGANFAKDCADEEKLRDSSWWPAPIVGESLLNAFRAVVCFGHNDDARRIAVNIAKLQQAVA